MGIRPLTLASGNYTDNLVESVPLIPIIRTQSAHNKGPAKIPGIVINADKTILVS